MGGFLGGDLEYFVNRLLFEFNIIDMFILVIIDLLSVWLCLKLLFLLREFGMFILLLCIVFFFIFFFLEKKNKRRKLCIIVIWMYWVFLMEVVILSIIKCLMD